MTVATIRSAWDAAIWQHSTILSYTDKINSFDITEDSQTEVRKLYSQGSINSFVYLVTRTRKDKMCNRVDYEYPVLIRYYLQADPSGENYNNVIDRLETLDALVVSQLGVTWDATVDFYRPQEGPITVALQTIDERPVWVGEYTYTGFKETAFP